MRRKNLSNSKQASLSLSMNAIVVVVLAFAMLGLGLTVTNMIFKSIQIPEIPVPNSAATSENPVAIASEIKVKRGGTVNLGFDYYNSDDGTQIAAKPRVKNCISSSDKVVTEVLYIGDTTNKQSFVAANLSDSSLYNNSGYAEKIQVPSYAVPPADIDPGTNHQFEGLFSLKDVEGYLGGQTYVCTMAIGAGTTSYETETFYLTIVS